jgi:hypothetical protein
MENFFSPVFDKINKMSLTDQRIRYCQLAPKHQMGTLSFSESIEYEILILYLELERKGS